MYLKKYSFYLSNKRNKDILLYREIYVIQNISWQDWVTDGALIGTTGQARQLEAIEIKLVEK